MKDGARAQAVGSLMLAQLGTVAGAFILNVLTARAMGPTGRGEIAFALQISYFVGALVILGRDRSVLAVSQDLGAEATFPRRSAIAPLCLALVSAAAFYLAVGSKPAAPVVALGFLLVVLGNLANRVLRADAILTSRTWQFMIASVAGQAVLVLAGAFLLARGVGSLQVWILAYGVSQLLPLLVLVPGWISRAKRRASAEVASGVASLGMRILPSTAIEMLGTKIDRILIPVIGAVSGLGIYAVAASMIEFATLPFRQHVDVLIPKWFSRAQVGKLRPLRELAGPALLSVATVLLIMFLAATLITPIFGEEYSSAVRLLPWLGLATWLHILAMYVNGMAVALNRASAATIMYSAGFVVSVPLYFLLIPVLGAAGAAVSLAVCYAVASVSGLKLLNTRGAQCGN